MPSRTEKRGRRVPVFRRRSIFRQTIGVCVYVCFLTIQFRAAAGGYHIDSWDSDTGLPDNFVTSIAQTPDGYLWIGTYNGLVRFDGRRFVTFKPEDTPQLGHERVVKLFLDAQGTLWINTYDGSLTSWRNGVFTREWDGTGKNISEAWMVGSNAREIIFAFHSGLLIRRPAMTARSTGWQILMPPGSPRSASYCQDGAGALWCNTYKSELYRVTNGRYEAIRKDPGLRGKEIHWLAPDLSGHIWAGTEMELAEWDGSRFENMTPEGESDLNVASFIFSKDGGLLVAANNRLRKYSNRKWVAEYEAWPDPMHEEQLASALHQDREGDIWRTSLNMGLFHLGANGATQNITDADGLPADHTTCWFEDREGSIWVGLGIAGLARLRKEYFETLTTPGQTAGAAMSVCEDQRGALWMGTYGNGLNRLQNGKLTNFQIPAANRDNYLFSIYPDKQGTIWMSAGMENLYTFQDGTVKAAPVAVHGIKSILVDSQGRVWLGRKAGLDRWANGKLREWTSIDNSDEAPIRTVVEDKQGVIWIGADNGVMYRVDGDNLRPLRLPASPAHQAIWTLLADADGSMWIGTADAGLLHYQAGRFTRFTVKDGLPDDLICQILDDQRGNLWLGTHHGICRVSKAALAAFAAGGTPSISCATFGRSDGLPTLQCSEMYQPSAWRAHDGRLWFATARGLVGVQPEEVPVNSQPPTVVVEEFLIGGKEQALPGGLQEARGAEVLKVPPGKKNFEFRYTALSLTEARKVSFRYRLDGFDSEWIDAGARRWTQYTYLRPGSYRFHVMACNNEGVWNETGASIAVQVLPHIWETWWFLTLMGLALIAGVASIARYASYREWRRDMARLERQRDIEQDRTRIAKDIHDHIGSGLTRINLLNELLLGDPAALLPDRVGQITCVTCELMSAMDEIVWALNPKNDTLDSLTSYLCDFADEYLRAANIRLRIDVPTSLPAWPLTSEVRHNLFLAAKEILNNIVKHSRAGEVFLTLRLEADSATLEIRDNGRGFPMDSEPWNVSPGMAGAKGNGLENLRKRAASIGGRCLIDSKPGMGTRIELGIPGPILERMPGQKFHPVHSNLN